MNIREAIAALQEAAAGLPDGLDAELHVVICDGTDMVQTGEVEVDQMHQFTHEMIATGKAWVIVKAHPHKQSIRMPGVTSDADEALREWTEGGDPPATSA